MAMTWAIDDATRDLVIVDGRLALVEGAGEVKQRVITALLHHWQEYFLNVPSGVPWFDLILGSKDLATAELILRAAVMAVPGVVSVVGFQTLFDHAARALTVALAVEVSAFGGTDVATVEVRVDDLGAPSIDNFVVYSG